MKKSPAFQFYPNDWLGSTKIMLMTPAEEGAYIRLLCIAWNAPDCGLLDDDDQLATLSRLGEGWFSGGSEKIKSCFEKKGDRLFNKRLLSERKKQKEWREKSRQGGIASGKSRKNKGLSPEGWLGSGATKPEPKGNTSSSSSSSSSSSNKKEYNGHFATLWTAYGYKKGKAKAEKAFTKAIKDKALDIPEDMDMLVKSISTYRTTIKKENILQAHFATWINDRRWEDELEDNKLSLYERARQ